MSRVLILCPDRLGPRLAGTAMRYLEMTRVLSRTHSVTLAVPAPPAGAWLDLGGAQLLALDGPGLRRQAAGADAVLVQGYTLRKLSWLAKSDVPLVVDLYDPAPLANLEIASRLPGGRARLDSHEECLGFTLEQLLHGDFFLAAHERARDFWLGMLTALGRVDPDSAASDGQLLRLLGVVPTGVPDREPPPASVPPSHPAYAGGRRPFVWSGGIWDWMDAETLLRAFARVAEKTPSAALLFLGTRHPNPDVPPQGAPARAEALARELGLLDRNVFFGDWVAYDERHRWLAHALAGVSLHGDHLETRFAWRTRLLDHLWLGLPSLVSRGDTLGERMERGGAALGANPGDAAAVEAGLNLLLEDAALREGQAAAARRLAAELRWPRVIGPLESFLKAPYTTRRRDQRLRYVDYLKEFLPHSPLHSAGLARMRRIYAREGGGGVVRRAFRRAARAVGLEGRPGRRPES
ncbi:MAG: glycosyltransferase family 4 protein [Candidatus Wallbacteria bacterium]|nr:glycosyltransferase family 4 protein [Candidatus Wallbacteria bacterium]